MTTIREPARDVPVAYACDLCVVGGGCTGVFAAVAAARLGARVALVENEGYFGGMATGGLVCLWHSMHDRFGERQIVAGLTAETLERLERRGALIRVGKEVLGNVVFNPEELKIELDALVAEAKVRPFLHTRLAGCAWEDGAPSAAIVEDKSGRRAIRARCFVDATGDGDLLARAGLPFRTNDDPQPPTTVAVFRGLEALMEQNPGFHYARNIFDKRYPEALPHGFCWGAPMAGLEDVTMVAGTRVPDADCSDADTLTAVEMEGRRQVRSMHEIFRTRCAGGEAVVLDRVASLAGVRETRHAECLYRVTEEDLLRGRAFPDAIGYGTYPVDVHHSGRPGITFRRLDGTETYTVPGEAPEQGRWLPEGEAGAAHYAIPYRSLVSREVRNVLVAGRLVDADRGAYGALRVMVNCNQTGEAAGTAAWLALDADTPAAEVDPETLRTTLRRRGAAIL